MDDYGYDLGSHTCPITTTSPLAQLWFDRGLIWTYGYNHEEAAVCFDELIEQTGGRRGERFRSVAERGIGAIARARKWSEELHGLIRGENAGSAADESLEPVVVLRQVAERMAPELGRAGIGLELMIPTQLPVACGDATLLETALVRLIRHRIAKSNPTTALTLSARTTVS